MNTQIAWKDAAEIIVISAIVAADRTVLLGAEFSLDAWVDDMRTRVEKLEKAQQGN